jgi:hypothetical protein
MPWSPQWSLSLRVPPTKTMYTPPLSPIMFSSTNYKLCILQFLFIASSFYIFSETFGPVLGPKQARSGGVTGLKVLGYKTDHSEPPGDIFKNK